MPDIHHFLTAVILEDLRRTFLFGELQIFNKALDFLFPDVLMIFDGLKQVFNLLLCKFVLPFFSQLDAFLNHFHYLKPIVCLSYLRIRLFAQLGSKIDKLENEEGFTRDLFSMVVLGCIVCLDQW